MLGYGWSWSFGEYLLIDPDDESRLFGCCPPGAHIPHTRESTWISPAGRKTTITLETSGEYTLAKQNGTVAYL